MTNRDTTEPGSTPGSGKAGEPKSAGRKAYLLIRELVIIVVGAILVSTLLRTFVAKPFVIPSGSMENTLLIGDRVVAQRITHFQRGDVVIFKDPGHWLPDPESDPTVLDQAMDFIGLPTASTPGHLIKRVIGTPGDRVICCDSRGRITVNGRALDEDSYLYSRSGGAQVKPSDRRFEVVVPKDKLFVLGDHRNISADSRYHLCDVSLNDSRGQVAFVPESYVVGPAFVIAWPLNRIERLRIPDTFADIPEPTDPAPTKGVITSAGGAC